MSANPECTTCSGTGEDPDFGGTCSMCEGFVPRMGGMGETLRSHNSSAPPNISRKVAEPVDDSWKRRPRWSKQPGGEFFVLTPKAIKAATGDTVTIARRDGTTSEVILGAKYDKNDWGDTLWYPVRPERVAATTPIAPTTNTAPPKVSVELTEGMYRTADDTIYKVQVAHHGSGQLYAKLLVKLDEPIVMKNGRIKTHEFVYERGAIRKLRPTDKMTLAEAKAWGALYGTCCVCGIILTKEESIERGMGSTCASKF